MPARKLPVIGAMFGQWTFLGDFKGRAWKCVCACGRIGWPHSCHLKSGASVGCRKCGTKVKHGEARDNQPRTKLYSVWRTMRARCLHPSAFGYAEYGGRGIKICAEWLADFRSFAAYVGEHPGKGKTLDRIDNDKGYEPGNVRWATSAEQARNRRSNRWITIGEETLCLTDWCARIGIKSCTASYRVRELGWSWEKAVTVPAMRDLFKQYK